MKTIAVMQPYFSPYAGYFRLMAEADVFVVFDCVQFPRRGWVHRNRFRSRTGALQWLTLPFQKVPQQTPIQHLEFASFAQTTWEDRLRPFAHLRTPLNTPIWNRFQQLSPTPVEYLISTLKYTCRRLNLETEWVRSSSLNTPAELRGQERILHIVKQLGGKRYINASGGVKLYDPHAFHAEGIKLDFLSPWNGSYDPMLQRLLLEQPAAIRSELFSEHDEMSSA